jgi:chromosome segregation ATPase
VRATQVTDGMARDDHAELKSAVDQAKANVQALEKERASTPERIDAAASAGDADELESLRRRRSEIGEHIRMATFGLKRCQLALVEARLEALGAEFVDANREREQTRAALDEAEAAWNKAASRAGNLRTTQGMLGDQAQYLRREIASIAPA